jgi:3-dehydroquinate synthase
MPERVRVKLGKRGYDIIVGERLLAQAGAHIKTAIKSNHVIIVSDETVAKFYLHRLTNSLEEHKIRYGTVIVKPGEATKSLDAFSSLLESLLEQHPDRHTTLIALGGGVVGDITGFAASTLLRGVDFIQIPTTLLSEVDSSVGGKTGINSRFGKNLIGSFHQPKLVLADVSTLASLPRRELMAGYAEVLKYGLLGNKKFFAWLEKNAKAMLAGDTKLLTQAIVESCKAKAAIVAADEKEAGKRALLNFGHTFAHALEAETGYSDTLLHGEAVAIGMLMAFETSVRMKLCKNAELDRVRAHYEAVELIASPRAIQPKWNIDRLMEHFSHDKKAKDGKLTFVLTRGIGKAFVTQDIDKSIIRAVLAEA